MAGRPSMCRPIFIQVNRTRRSDLASRSASLYRACSVPGFVIVWLANNGPEASGVRLDPVRSIPNRGQRFFLSALCSAMAARFPPIREMIPSRLANVWHACLTEGVRPVRILSLIRCSQTAIQMSARRSRGVTVVPGGRPRRRFTGCTITSAVREGCESEAKEGKDLGYSGYRNVVMLPVICREFPVLGKSFPVKLTREFDNTRPATLGFPEGTALSRLPNARIP